MLEVEEKEIWGLPVKTLLATPVSASWYGLQGLLDQGFTKEAARQWWSTWNPPLRSLVRQGDMCFDCGAHQGFLTTLLALAVGEKGGVLGFEPYEPHVVVAQRNIELNNLGGRAAVLHMAMGAYPFQHHVLRVKDEMISDHEGDHVDTGILDDFIAGSPNKTGRLVKIDVEGYEVQVLRGAHAVLSLPETRVEMELHLFGTGRPDVRNYGDTPADAFRILTEHGLKVHVQGPNFRYDRPNWTRLDNLDSFTKGCLYAFRD